MQEKELFKTIQEAYIYGYPIMGMYELLYDQILNSTTKTANFNEFAHTATVADPKTSFVPAPNNDTTYSRAWLDLRQGPVTIETPDTGDRFFSIQFLDMYSETIVNVGRRLNGTKANTFIVVGPNYVGELPKDVQIIKSNTVFVLAFLRVLVKDKGEIEQIKAIQNQFNITAPAPSKAKLPNYHNETHLAFFETLNQVLELLPQMPCDKVVLDKIAAIGVGAGQPPEKIKGIEEDLLNKACDTALSQIDEKGLEFGESVNNWRIARAGIGNYGTDYLQRSVVWFKGALANQPEESLYPSVFQDSQGQPLDGKNQYELRFEKSQLPQVSQFWSLTMYLFSNGFLVDNDIDRYSIGDRTDGIQYDQDGGLTIYIQNEAPAQPQKKANWLPAPKETFYLTLRLYGPSKETVLGKWNPPPIIKVN